MKRILLCALLLAFCTACDDKGGTMIGGVYFKCARDPERERHFEGLSGDVLEEEALKTANDWCDAHWSSRALEIVFVFKNGTQKEYHRE